MVMASGTFTNFVPSCNTHHFEHGDANFCLLLLTKLVIWVILVVYVARGNYCLWRNT